MTGMKINGGKGLLVVLGLLAMLPAAEASGPFSAQYADLCLGFRKTGTYPSVYECVVDIGQATAYTGMAPGTTTTISQFTAAQLNPDTYASLTNLSWSVTGFVQTTNQPAGYPASTLWISVPRTVAGGSTTAPARSSASTQAQAIANINGIFLGAEYFSGTYAAGPVNTATFVQEQNNAAGNPQYYSYFMGDLNYSTIGDLQGTAPTSTNGSLINLEFTTAAPFTSPAQADLYEVRPSYLSAGRPATNLFIVDPNTGLTTGPGAYVGYFSLSPSGTMTFTRAAAPVASFTGTPLTGSAPLTVVFNNTSSGTITNWSWSFGDGHTFTNTASGTATNTYTTAGSYTVKLTVTGALGTNTSSVTNYVVVSGGGTPAPVASFTGAPTNGFAPLTVILTDTSTGTVTNRLWSFGDGHTYTNGTSLYATNTYTTNGAFTVSLTAAGPGGTNTSSAAKYVVVSPAPHFSGAALNGTSLVLSGTNGPAGVQYRILTTTNLTTALASWAPVYTNTFTASGGFRYTNSTTKAQGYFKLVSP
jgi:PKD repeat protein